MLAHTLDYFKHRRIVLVLTRATERKVDGMKPLAVGFGNVEVHFIGAMSLATVICVG